MRTILTSKKVAMIEINLDNQGVVSEDARTRFTDKLRLVKGELGAAERCIDLMDQCKKRDLLIGTPLRSEGYDDRRMLMTSAGLHSYRALVLVNGLVSCTRRGE